MAALLEEEESGDPGPKRHPWLRGLYLDLRSLALFRVALGLCLIADLLFRISQIDEFYDDRGAYPREAVVGAMRGSWAISVHFISGLWSVELVLFVLALVFAIGFTLGYRTRLCAVVSWFLVMSMQVRSGIVLHGGDDLIRLLLFWCMFLPLNGRGSVDRILNPDAKPLALSHLSPGSLALIFQICAMYWYTAAEKMHPVWLTERAAVYYTLSLDQFAKPLGHFLLGFPALLPILTTATLILEFFGPILALLPFRNAALRLLTISMFISFHVGLGLTLRLGTFPWLCVTAWLVFLPPEFWDFLARRLPGISSRLSFLRRLPDFLFQPPLRPPAPRQNFGWATSILILLCLVLTEAALSSRPTLGLRRFALLEAKLITLTQLNQTWRMFAPTPRRDDGWYVMEGITRGGSRVDVWQGGIPDYGKPKDFGAYFRNAQWLKYLENIRRDGFTGYQPYFGRYLCRLWNHRHYGMEQVDTLHIRFVLEMTPAPGHPPEPVKREDVFTYACRAGLTGTQ